MYSKDEDSMISHQVSLCYARYLTNSRIQRVWSILSAKLYSREQETVDHGLSLAI